jgi:hypothetical protein
MAQALRAQLARPAAALCSSELVAGAPSGYAAAAIAVELLTRRANAGVSGCIHAKGFGAKQLAAFAILLIAAPSIFYWANGIFPI